MQHRREFGFRLMMCGTGSQTGQAGRNRAAPDCDPADEHADAFRWLGQPYDVPGDLPDQVVKPDHGVAAANPEPLV
jgi:hypothetical protein